MKRRDAAFDSDLADGSLEFVALAYSSVASYEGGWEHIHPEDQAEWLASFEAVRSHVTQLAEWAAKRLLDPDQLARYQHLANQREVVEGALARLEVTHRPPSAAKARAAAVQCLILED